MEEASYIKEMQEKCQIFLQVKINIKVENVTKPNGTMKKNLFKKELDINN